MRRKLAAVVGAAATAWALAVGAAGLPAQVGQVDSPGSNTVAETPASVKMYFDRARKLGFPAAGQSKPYILRAEFTARGSSGAVETGTYTDTWVSDTKWRREAAMGKSSFVRSRNGKKRYRLDNGPDEALLQFVLTAMEPIPVSDSVRESQWTIKPDTVDGTPATRVARGKEDPDGGNNASDFEAYWFDDSGQLVKTYLNALQTRRSNFEDFNGVHVARRVEVILAGKVGMRIDVTALDPAGKVDSHIFAIKRHEWMPQATSEAR
jgi:hypothetical protein